MTKRLLNSSKASTQTQQNFPGFTPKKLNKQSSINILWEYGLNSFINETARLNDTLELFSLPQELFTFALEIVNLLFMRYKFGYRRNLERRVCTSTMKTSIQFSHILLNDFFSKIIICLNTSLKLPPYARGSQLHFLSYYCYANIFPVTALFI